MSDTPPEDGYEGFFGFSAPPFSLSANPRFRFPSAAHEEALLQVLYGLQRREPVLVVTGDIGLGKTLLCRTVLQRLPSKTFLSVINDPMLGRDDLLKRILEDFGVISAEHGASINASRHDLAHAMNTFLASLGSLDAHAVVIIDEAQHMQPEVVEQIRLLANTSDDRGTLLQIVLVGQPGLQELLARPELQQLRQRVTRHVSLSALTDAEVKQYIAHRLAVAREAQTDSPLLGVHELAREVAQWNASMRPVAFTDEAIQAVTRIAHGVPRLVNVLCDRALEAAFAQQSRSVDAPAVQTAARLLQLADAPVEGTTHEAAAHEAAAPEGSAPEAAIVPEPAAREEIQSQARSRALWYAAAAVAVVLVVGVISVGVRSLHRESVSERHGVEAPAPPRQVPNAAVPAPAPPAAPAPPQSDPVTPAHAATQNPSAPDAAAAANDALEIAVASFRTEARANEVVSQLTGLGHAARRRFSDGWQQVVAGPFANEAAAKDAQEQLDREGFSGTHVARAAP